MEKLVAAGRIPSSLGQKISALEPGTYVVHKSWGGGEIAAWELADERVLINFRDKPGHPMKLEFAAKSLTAVEAGHICVKLVTDPEGTRAMAKEKPVEFVRSVLESNGGRMYLDTFDEFVKEAFVPVASYKAWWEAAKKKLRADKSFVVPTKRSEPLELRSGGLSQAEALISDFGAVRDLKSKAKALAVITKEVSSFEAPDVELDELINEVNEGITRGSRLQLAHALELLTARDELQAAVPALSREGQPTIEATIQEGRKKLAAVLPKLQVGSQRAVYAAFKNAFGEDGWVDAMLELLQSAGQRGIVEVTKILIAEGEEARIIGYIRHGLQQRNLSQDLLAWACRERNNLAAEVFGPELGNALINSLEKEHYDDESPTNNRLRDLLVNDADIIPDLVRDAETGYVKTLTRRLMMTPVFEELSKRSILARIVKLHPEMESLVSGDSWGREAEAAEEPSTLIVSWESLQARQKTLDELINRKIPKNKREINAARELGDLRENFEYHAAKDQQKILFRQRDELESELKSARGTDFQGADTSQVNIGTVVDICDEVSGESHSFTILGAWDSDVDKGIIAYLTETGDALLRSKIGDVVEIPTEEAGVSRSVKVVAIGSYNA